MAPFARYSKSAKEGMLDIEAGVIVPDGTKGEGEIVAGTLPAGKVAMAMHMGGHTDLSKTHTAIKAHLAAKGLKESGVSWEMYLNDPATVKPEEIGTEIYYLLDEKK